MSNQIFIDVNEVKNVVTKTVFFEIKAWDNYYSGDIHVEEDRVPKTNLEALQYLKDDESKESPNICDIIDAIQEYENEVTINGTFYEWEEIKHIFKE